ncbi:MAG: PAS domain S-box protein [Deltaproteobacteria bacterium]|nr:PAS domain S-box protein [Deltaproteobacteria bacterium]
MSKKEGISDQKKVLRRGAREKNKAPAGPKNDQETSQILYELQGHQVELEMQNDELRRTQQELETSRARYFDLYNLAPVGYCTIDQQGLILEANLTAAAQLGVAREALGAQSIRRFVFAEDQDVYSHRCRQLFETCAPQVCELRLQRPDAAVFWARMEANLAHGPDGLPLCRLVISDITDRKRIEEALRMSEEKYRTVADFTYDWEFWLGPDNNFLYCSPSCLRITGYPAEAFDRDPALLRTLVHPDDLAVYDQHFRTAKNREMSPEFEFRISHVNESTGWRWIAHVCQPVYDDKGRFLGIRGSNRDVTGRKRLEAEVAKARNLESLGVLAGGIAHDFNNLFQALLGNLALAKMYTPESSKAFLFLENAEQVSALATKLTSRLIAFSSGGLSLMINIQPSSHIREEATATLGSSGLAAEFDLADDLWLINVDAAQFRQVIKQMVLNAMESMPPGSGGKLRIMAVNEALQAHPGMSPTLAPGNYVRISIQDQGCGVSSENLPRIFDPYFSTKQRGCQKGLGLGLALCDTIIRKHGGAITVKSQPDKGATFHIHIPAVVIAARKTETTKDRKTHGPRILFMDDDLGVVQVTRNFLRLSGYRVDSTLDGNATIAAYQEARAAGDPYAAVILDLMIPGGMGGKEVIAVLRQIDPEVKAIVSSGYADDHAMTDFADYGFVAACAKPYQLTDMKKILDRFV